MTNTSKKTPAITSKVVQYSFAFNVEGIDPSEIARRYGVKRTTILKALRNVRAYNVACRARGETYNTILSLIPKY